MKNLHFHFKKVSSTHKRLLSFEWNLLQMSKIKIDFVHLGSGNKNVV